MTFKGGREREEKTTYQQPAWITNCSYKCLPKYCQTPVLGLGLGVDFTFGGDNHNHNHNDNPHLNFVKGTVLGDREQG